MGSIGPEKIILIVVVLLLLFGAKRLPELGASLGKGIREFKGSLSDKGDAPRESIPPAPPASASATTPADETAEPKRLLP